MKKNKKGSLLVGVIIIMFIVASISLAIVFRSSQSAQITIGSKQGFSAYQASDQTAEKILDNIKNLDNADDGKIPENTNVSEVCSEEGVTCLDKNGEEMNSVDKVLDIKEIKGSGTGQTTKRAVSVPVPSRVPNPVIPLSMKIEVENDELNQCNPSISFKVGSLSEACKNVDSLELRYSENRSALSAGSWKKIITFDDCVEVSGKNIGNANFDYGETYYFAIKAKNKNNFYLDSLYYPTDADTKVSFTAPAIEGCSGISSKCFPFPPSNSELIGEQYTCCGGTGCYKCMNGYQEENDACVKITP